MRLRGFLQMMMAVLLLSMFVVPSVMAGGSAEEEAGSADGGESAPSPTQLVFGTGGTSGLYYPIGGALKTVFEESQMVRAVNVESTGASVMNINNIDSGINQVAIVMSDVAYDARNGRGQFEGNPVDVQAIAGLYPNVVQVVATDSSGITSIEDMQGKRVGVGQVGSGVEQSAQKVLESAGLTYDDLGQVTNTGYADSVQSMKNGTLDAAFFTSGIPNANIVDVMQTMDVVFVPVDGSVAETLIENYPFYENFEIPAGVSAQYDLDAAVQTVAIRNLLIVSPDLPEELVSELTGRFYEYLGSEQVTIDALRQFDRDAMDRNLVLELHPGAQQFYGSR
ncbi:MAG: TAXI family TRAP transporter solute-binding subunit [Alkalispirochaeta sp.]